MTVAGDHVELGLAGGSGIDHSGIRAGSVLCDPRAPVPLASALEVHVRTLELGVPLTPGLACELYCHAGATAATVEAIIASLDKRGGRVVAPTPPRAVCSNAGAALRLRLERPGCFELYSACRPMGRAVLREAGRTIAYGIVTALVAADESQ